MNFLRTSTQALLPFSIMLLTSAVAHADDDAAAQAAMQRGIAAYGQGDIRGALAAYEEAEKFAPRANVPFLYAAEALVRLERFPEAVASLEHYLSVNPDVSDAPEVRERIATIRRQHFPGRVNVTTNPASAHLTIDGILRAETAPTILTLPAGAHTIAFSSNGYEPATLTVVAVGDSEIPANATLQLIPPKPIDVPAPDPALTTSSWMRTTGWILTGVGAATLGTAIVLDWSALKQKTDDFNTAKSQGSDSAIGLQSDVRSLRTGVVGTYIAGGVIAAGGVALVLFAPRSAAKTAGSATLRLESRVLPERSELSLTGTF